MSRGKADTPTSDYVRLDKDFKKNIEDIKPFVLKLEAKRKLKSIVQSYYKKFLYHLNFVDALLILQ